MHMGAERTAAARPVITWSLAAARAASYYIGVVLASIAQAVVAIGGNRLPS